MSLLQMSLGVIPAEAGIQALQAFLDPILSGYPRLRSAVSEN